ncbi:YigZ family protein [Dechloromonas sp. ZY10]|uniref:IMPACT family protein n=1 Tax=Dechloromonas aquae TaxID=2664436 RepID=UPI0035283391
MANALMAPATAELTIRKSRFLARIENVASREEALRIVADLRRQHPGAAHVCWALLAGGQSAAVDDGEPSGTAGRPMLDVLRHRDLDGVLATVVRYFGGVKLGAGGLIRAYTDSVARALAEACLVPQVARLRLCCVLPYAREGWLRRELQAAGAVLEAVEHGQAVRVVLSLPCDQADNLRRRLDENGGGQVCWEAT